MSCHLQTATSFFPWLLQKSYLLHEKKNLRKQRKICILLALTIFLLDIFFTGFLANFNVCEKFCGRCFCVFKSIEVKKPQDQKIGQKFLYKSKNAIEYVYFLGKFHIFLVLWFNGEFICHNISFDSF